MLIQIKLKLTDGCIRIPIAQILANQRACSGPPQKLTFVSKSVLEQ